MRVARSTQQEPAAWSTRFPDEAELVIDAYHQALPPTEIVSLVHGKLS